MQPSGKPAACSAYRPEHLSERYRYLCKGSRFRVNFVADVSHILHRTELLYTSDMNGNIMQTSYATSAGLHAGQAYRTPSGFQLPDLGSLGGLAGIAGLGLSAFGGGLGGGLSSLLRLAAPVGGAYLGWNYGADVLRSTSVGQSAVGWLSSSPLGGFLGRDPYRPVGGALGALAGYALSRIVF